VGAKWQKKTGEEEIGGGEMGEGVSHNHEELRIRGTFDLGLITGLVAEIGGNHPQQKDLAKEQGGERHGDSGAGKLPEKI